MTTKIIQNFQDQYPFQLDTFQLKAIEHLLQQQSVMVTAPTGSGKTIIAEFAVFDALDRNMKVVYTTPLKALSNQKYRDFCQLYGEDKIGLVTGDVSLQPQANVTVMTTEILRNILYQNPQRLDEVIYVVIDECHYMNDEDRGTVWEEIIIHAPQHLIMVALSATIANAQELTAWITSIHREMVVIEHIERPVPLNYFYFEKKLFNLFSSNGNMSKPVKRIVQQIKQDKINRRRHGKKYKKPSRKDLISPAKVVMTLDEKELLPAIYFIFSRLGCNEAMETCLLQGWKLTNKNEKREIQARIQTLIQENPSLKETGPSTSKLLEALPLGFATHHAALVPILRHFVEVLFQENLIKIVFATETLAAGINMPARTTIIKSLSKRTDWGHRILNVNEFTQMTGRAGRRGKDIEGFCVVVHNNFQSPTQAYDLVQGSYDPIESHFTLSYNMVLNLLNNFEEKQIRTILQKSFGQYLNNKEIINLGLELERKEQALQKSDFIEHDRVRHLRRQIRRIKREITNQKEVYLQEFFALVRVLETFGHVERNKELPKLTQLGLLTSHIRANNDLLISLILQTVDFTNVSPVDLAVLLSTCIFEPRRRMSIDLSPCSKQVKRLFDICYELADELQYIQNNEGVHLSVSVELDFAPIVALWGNGCRWSTLFKFTEMADGDIVRSMRQLIDLLHQLSNAPLLVDMIKDKVRLAIEALDRDLIKIVI